MAVKLTHRLNGASIEVADEKAAEFWLERGFAAAESEPAPAKKAPAKKSASSAKKK